jgi:hypothetical protein
MPRLKKFIEKYPHKTIKIETVNHTASLSHTDADVAIFPRIDDPGNVVKRKLLTSVICEKILLRTIWSTRVGG